MKKNRRDILFIVILIVLIVSLFLVRKCIYNSEEQNVEITQDGVILYVLSINENQTITLDNEFGYNVIQIKDGKVYMETSDCNGQDCIRQGRIDREGASVICLPHKLMISVRGGNNAHIDSMAK